MAKVYVSMDSTDETTGKKRQKVVPGIDATATSKQITDLTKALSDLTTDTYQSTNRVAKLNCDTEEADGVFAYLKVGTVSSTEEGAMWLEEG